MDEFIALTKKPPKQKGQRKKKIKQNKNNNMANENQTPVVKESAGQFQLNWRDAGLGLIVAVITAALTAILDSINNGATNINWKTVGIVAATAGISYLLKNFFTPAKTIIMAPKEEVRITEHATGKTLTTEPK